MDLNPIEVQKALKGVSYPASKDDLLSAARSNGGSQDVVGALEGLGDQSFDGPDQVMKALNR